MPIGLSDQPGQAHAMVFCPRCNDVFTPRSQTAARMDGAFFGTSFPHMLFAVHAEARPEQNPPAFEPRIYGFKLHPTAYAQMERRWEREQEAEQKLSKGGHA